jgi:hypothetical protein
MSPECRHISVTVYPGRRLRGRVLRAYVALHGRDPPALLPGWLPSRRHPRRVRDQSLLHTRLASDGWLETTAFEGPYDMAEEVDRFARSMHSRLAAWHEVTTSAVRAGGRRVLWGSDSL